MVTMKQAKTSAQRKMLATIAVSVAVIFSSVSLYSSSFGDYGEAGAISGPHEPSILAVSRVRMAPSLSAKESYGWFDDIPNEGWQLMKLRARTAIQYTNPWKPQTGYDDPIMWYLNNLQVSRLLSI
jgi:hypothetical protein